MYCFVIQDVCAVFSPGYFGSQIVDNGDISRSGPVEYTCTMGQSHDDKQDYSGAFSICPFKYGLVDC